MKRLIVVAPLLLLACGKGPVRPVLDEATFRSIAERCHAQDVRFSAASADDAPTIGYRDEVTRINGKPVRVVECINNDLKPYRIARIELTRVERAGGGL